jgi:hypothetical protein
MDGWVMTRTTYRFDLIQMFVVESIVSYEHAWTAVKYAIDVVIGLASS